MSSRPEENPKINEINIRFTKPPVNSPVRDMEDAFGMEFDGLIEVADLIETQHPELLWLEGAREFARRVREESQELPLGVMIRRCLVAGVILGRATDREEKIDDINHLIP